MKLSRALISAVLAVLCTVLIISVDPLIVVQISCSAVTYDVLNLFKMYPLVATVLYGLLVTFHQLAYKVYLIQPTQVLLVITLAQLADVYQYIVGKHWGISKIGWVSPNKTIEGYMGGYLLTLLSFYWMLSLAQITLLYIVAVTGGLLSSALKRWLKLKDYSNLLAEQGGWIDRIDSIILPVIYLYITI